MSVAHEDKMDATTNTHLGRMLLEEITPVVMVLRTPLVEAACQKNNFNFVQMLLPFTLFNKIDVPVRTASDQPYRLQMFKLRLVYASDVCQKNGEAAEEHLKQVINMASEDVLLDLQQDPPQLETVLSMAESKSMSSLFQIFNKELVHTLSFADHEAFDHPVACLMVVSSMDDQPVSKFVDLFNTGQLPSLLNEGAMDPKILKHYILVHDNQEGHSERALDILTEMKSTFGANDCKLLCINSAQDGDEERKDNPWISCKIGDSLGSDVGHFLNINDLYELKDLMQDLSSKHIIPHMEQKIRSLNQQVSATRKGFKNQIKNLWWRKGKEDALDNPNGPMYTFSSVESQIRVLGDYAFMLRDYELALSSYRLLSTDYKLDKAWKRYAGVQEMMGLSLFMLDQLRKEAEYCMETAFTTYLKIGSSGQRNATRCGVWWAEMLKARSQYKEAAGVYFRISTEETSLHAAAMLEQASYCYLYSNPPMLRKYGFHLVLAGNQYSICDQRKQAIRAYRSALPVYKGHAWNYISDHVHFNIGRWFAFFGLYDVAIKHMLEVLACNHQSVATQQLFFSDFIHIVQNTGKQFYAFRLQLPVINVASLNVLFEDHRTYASPDAARVKESFWQSLEEEMVPSTTSIRTNWLDSLPKSLSIKKRNESSLCIAGEAIKVDIEFRNPLQIPITISGVSLACEHFTRSDVTESDDQSLNDEDERRLASGFYDNTEVSKFIPNRELDAGAASFISSEVGYTLEGGEAKMVHLNVTPKVEGILKIIGVRWTLSGSIVGYHNFDSDLSKKKHIKGRKNVAIKSSAIHNLKFAVIKSLPKLEGCIHHLPQKTYTGDLRRLILELKNSSESSVKNLKMRINHPRFLIAGKLKDMDMDFPACLEEIRSCESSSMQDNVKCKSSVFSFPEDVSIQGGMTFSWPLWLHSGVCGRISLNISVYYEMENVSEEMAYRTLRMHYDLEVMPSLDISVCISPSPSRLLEFLVRMDIINKSSSESFWLRQVSSIGNQWKFSSLMPCGLAEEGSDNFLPQSDDAKSGNAYLSTPACPSQVLLAGQALSCFFKLMGSGISSTKKGTSPSRRSEQKTDIGLGPLGNNEALIDVSSSPLSEFYLHERNHQDKSNQVCGSTLDFIVISQPLKDGTNFRPEGFSDASQLSSHYVCHCSISSICPVQWLMEGPQTVNHDFSISLCKIGFRITVRNCSNGIASIKISTFDITPSTGWQSSDTPRSPISSSGFQVVGWHDTSLPNSGKSFSEVQGISTPTSNASSLENIMPPFIWCASSSTQLRLGSMATAIVPLEICVFSPGTYELSNYELHWNLEPSDAGKGFVDAMEGQSSGTSPGHPLYLTVMQST